MFLTDKVVLDDLGAGHFRQTLAMKPIAVRQNGSLVAMQTDFADSGDGTTPHIVNIAPLRSRVANDGMRRLYPIQGDDASYLEIGAPFVKVGGTWTQVSLGAPTRSANLITWTRPQTITRVQHGGHFVKLDIELRGGFVPEDSQVAFPVGLTGLTRSSTSILKNGNPVMQLRPFVMEDAGNLDDIRPITHQFTTLSGQPYLLLTLPSLTGMTRPRIDPTLTLQPDATAGIDTYTRQDAATTANTTASTVIMRGDSGNRRRGLFKFDLSSLAGVTVNTATFTGFCGNVTANARSADFFAILAANSGWVEGATWDYANPSTVRWAGDAGADGGTDAGCSVSGTDYNASVLGTLTWGSSDAADTQYDVTLTAAAIQTMVAANYGMVLAGSTAFTELKSVRSSDYATDATKRPKLVIGYTAAGADDSNAQTIQIGSRLGVAQMRTGGARMMFLN